MTKGSLKTIKVPVFTPGKRENSFYEQIKTGAVPHENFNRTSILTYSYDDNGNLVRESISKNK